MSKSNIALAIFGIIGIAALIGLFFILKPKTPVPKSSPVVSTASKPAASSSAQPISNTKSFDITVQKKKLVSGPPIIQVVQGTEVTINIISDVAEELHLHGYDRSITLEPQKLAKLTFSANLTGRFPYELEKSKIEIGALEVQPK